VTGGWREAAAEGTAARGRGAVTGGWREAAPELVIGGLAVAAACAGAWAFAGVAAAVVVLAGAGAVALVVLRFLTPADDVPPAFEHPEDQRARTTFAGFWRRRAGVQAATEAMTAYDFELRGTLQHLLAARLAELHGISLYDDPEAARKLVTAGGRDRLWFWLDPARPAVTEHSRSAGIPPRTLAAILDRLERL
jgi:hypothetical protein